MKSISRGKTYKFKGKDGVVRQGIFTGNIHKWVGNTAILILEGEEGVKYLVPDNLIIGEVEDV